MRVTSGLDLTQIRARPRDCHSTGDMGKGYANEARLGNRDWISKLDGHMLTAPRHHTPSISRCGGAGWVPFCVALCAGYVVHSRVHQRLGTRYAQWPRHVVMQPCAPTLPQTYVVQRVVGHHLVQRRAGYSRDMLLMVSRRRTNHGKPTIVRGKSTLVSDRVIRDHGFIHPMMYPCPLIDPSNSCHCR